MRKAVRTVRALGGYLARQWRHNRETHAGDRCNLCKERYTNLARDCACTNWGGFIGV